MKFSCSKADFLKAVNIASKTSYVKVSKSILECVHITTADEQIILNTFDTVTAIKCSVFASIIEPGQTAVPAKMLLEILSKFPDGEICVQSEKSGIKLTCANAFASLSEMDATQFPSFPTVDGVKITVGASELKKLIDGTSFAVYQSDDKPIYTGMLFETTANEFSVVALDGIRLAKRKIDWQTTAVKAIIPAKSLKDLSRIIEDGDSAVDLYISKNACFITVGTIDIYTRLLEGEFMNYVNIIPKTYKTRVRFETAIMRKSLEVVSVMAREDSNNQIRMNIGEKTITLKSNSEYGTIEDVIPVYMEGEMLNVAFNVRYLLELFKNIEETEVLMDFEGKLKPSVVRPVTGEDFMYMVVPVNLREG